MRCPALWPPWYRTTSVALLRQVVGEAALALVTPLGADDHRARHQWLPWAGTPPGRAKRSNKRNGNTRLVSRWGHVVDRSRGRRRRFRLSVTADSLGTRPPSHAIPGRTPHDPEEDHPWHRETTDDWLAKGRAIQTQLWGEQVGSGGRLPAAELAPDFFPLVTEFAFGMFGRGRACPCATGA